VTTLDLVAGYLIIGIVVILLITFLIKLKKKEPLSPVEKHMPLIIMGILLIYVVLLAVRYTTGISNADRLQILLQLGLVSITAVYAWFARQQAEENAKMAEEMQNQRYDLFRPVVNIEVPPSGIAALSHRMFHANSMAGARDLPHEIPCVLHNVGIGPAIDIYANIRVGDKKCYKQHSLGTLSKDGKSDEQLLALQEQGMNNGLLLVIYSDAYGRSFASKREIYLAGDESGDKLEVSPLQLFKLPKGEEEKAINELQKDIKTQIR
jgi:hypothetical protein